MKKTHIIFRINDTMYLFHPQHCQVLYFRRLWFIKKRLVTYLLVSTLAAAVFAGCSKKDADAGDGADAAATGDAVVVEEAAETADAAATDSIEDLVAAAEAADAEEVAAVAGTTDAVAEADEEAADEEAAVTEVVDEEEEKAEEAEELKEGEYLIVEPGTQYVVRFGGNIYSTPEEVAENVMYFANPGDYLNVVERLDDFWYKVTYYLAGEGIEHTGYIQIQ